MMIDRIPFINMDETAKNITFVRERAGVSIKELQLIFGFNTPTSIYKWESGACLPSIDNLVILSKVLNVQIEDIIATDEIPYENSKKPIISSGIFRCPKCRKEIKITRAIKSRVRTEPYKYYCICGETVYISEDDVDALQKHKLSNCSEKHVFKRKEM